MLRFAQHDIDAPTLVIYFSYMTLRDPMQERQPANQRRNRQPELNVSKYRGSRFIRLHSTHPFGGCCAPGRPKPRPISASVGDP